MTTKIPVSISSGQRPVTPCNTLLKSEQPINTLTLGHLLQFYSLEEGRTTRHQDHSHIHVLFKGMYILHHLDNDNTLLASPRFSAMSANAHSPVSALPLTVCRRPQTAYMCHAIAEPIQTQIPFHTAQNVRTSGLLLSVLFPNCWLTLPGRSP